MASIVCEGARPSTGNFRMRRDGPRKLLCSILFFAAIATVSSVRAVVSSTVEIPSVPDQSKIEFHWGVKIPVRDGIQLNATVYTPRGQKSPAPCIVTLTPYVAQTYHDRGVYFAAHGYPFVAVDVRGRGNSEGHFEPLIQEAHDGFDVVEWVAQQPYCDGRVGMWGGSYAGYDQWAAAKELPPHLATIVPVASPYVGVDFPMLNNIFSPYNMEWLTYTSGRTLQEKIRADVLFWGAKCREWFESGVALKDFDSQLGNPSAEFQVWLQHPHPDSYWDSYNPTPEQYARLAIPILTITGSYDSDQPGALTHYREYMKVASAQGRARSFLIIGPWDHLGTRTPQAEFGNLKFGPASLVDLPELHLEWYSWTMQGGVKPKFLQKPVAYYVMGAERWRYADTLQGVTAQLRPYFLDSRGDATDVFSDGSLGALTAKGSPDHYVYDPHDLSFAAYEATADSNDLTDQTTVYAHRGKQLVYHTAPFEQETEISGFFKLCAWIAIDQPDTDFVVSIYEIRPGGDSILLTSDLLRARYRESWRKPKLITTRAPLLYTFERFTFTSRRVAKGSRLRLTIAPLNSISMEKNYNTADEVATESMKDARSVNVSLYHDPAHRSALYVPFGQPETP
jgi:uncharacterized protein